MVGEKMGTMAEEAVQEVPVGALTYWRQMEQTEVQAMRLEAQDKAPQHENLQKAQGDCIHEAAVVIVMGQPKGILILAMAEHVQSAVQV